MMGERQALQSSLFYEFNLEDHVPSDHLLGCIDRFVDLSEMRRRLEPFYSRLGRPSIDPELMIRMLIIGYSHGIRSERRLCPEVHLNLAYRWFCRLDLNDPVPDHSTFSKNRRGRFRESDLFRILFEEVLARCIGEGLVGGDAFGVDASLIRADANREDGIAPADWSPEDHASRAATEYLATLDDAAFGAATPVEPKFISPVDPAALEAEAISKDPANIRKRVIALWNICARRVENWPDIRLSLPFKPEAFALPPEDFPESLQTDLVSWEARMATADPGSVRATLSDLEDRKRALKEQMADDVALGSVEIHPNIAELYRRKVSELGALLEDEAARPEAMEVIRRLVERIEVRPGAKRGQPDVTLVGALASILNFACRADKKKPPRAEAA